MSNFQPLEVVDRGSETQPQVGENLNKIISKKSIYHVLFHTSDAFLSTVLLFLQNNDSNDFKCM